MHKFVYVFSEAERDTLLSLHYNLLKSDETRHIYVFENRNDLQFDLHDVNAIPSDILTF